LAERVTIQIVVFGKEKMNFFGCEKYIYLHGFKFYKINTRLKLTKKAIFFSVQCDCQSCFCYDDEELN